MALWLLLIGMLLALFAAGVLYISFRGAQFPLVQRLTNGRRGLGRLVCLAFFLALSGLLWALWNLMNAVVCLLHLIVFWLLCDLVAFLIAKARRQKPRRYWAGAAALVLCILYLAGGWVAAHHVWETDYRFSSPKLREDIKLVQITDSHVGATFDAQGFLRHMERVNALAPDVVVVTGDFVDDDTSRADMLASCDALGHLSAPLGVYFVFGNHDKGYSAASRRGWTVEELREALERNGVAILEDEGVAVGESLWIAGRKDRSEEQRNGGRMTAQELLSTANRSRYIVLLDHQPHDFDAEAEAGADLVLCGHTHGGQFIPINHVGEWIGENALYYGHERRLGTDFIVSSGISNWTFRFKTGCWSEIVMVSLLPEGAPAEAVAEAPAVAPTAVALTLPPASETPAPVPTPEPTNTPEPTDTPEPPTERTIAQIVEEMAVYRARDGAKAAEKVSSLLGEMATAYPDEAQKWAKIMDLWGTLEERAPVSTGVLPDGLPDTGELCIVVLGYQLNANGTMKNQLKERLQVALKSAQKYPNAPILCTGGGTASQKKSATEAGQMASWLKKKGIGEDRILVEKSSKTTAQNAQYSYELLSQERPEVKYIALISGDYHVHVGVLLFEAEAVLRAGPGEEPSYTVAANAGCKTSQTELSRLFQAGGLIELAGNGKAAHKLYYNTYDLKQWPPLP